MLRDLFTNKWVLGGVGFLIVFAIACYLWYQHDIADEKKAVAEANKLLRQSEIAKKVSDTDSEAGKTTGIPKDGTTQPAEIPMTKTTDKVEKDTVSDGTSVNLTQQTQETDKEVRVSPFGFGAYPEVPEGFPYPAAWDVPYIGSHWDERAKIQDELLCRVQIKLWTQGVKTEGASMENGLVYPIIKGVVYVKWDEYIGPDGRPVRYISEMLGYPDDDSIDRLESIEKAKKKDESFTEADVPDDIKLILYEGGGIDPYTFLDLPKKGE